MNQSQMECMQCRVIQNAEFRLTMITRACPEQWEVRNKNGKMCGYVRLRWGGLTVQYPDSNGESIFYEHINAEGCFRNESQRMKYLKTVLRVIKNEQSRQKEEEEEC